MTFPALHNQTITDIKVAFTLDIRTEHWYFQLEGDTLLVTPDGVREVVMDSHDLYLPDYLAPLIGRSVTNVLATEQGHLAINSTVVRSA